MSESFTPSFKDILQSIPGVFGIRLEEEPAFDVVETIGDVEIRRYQPALIAQVTVPGDHETALNRAFTMLAGYIYGGNEADEKMPMTSPVYQARGDLGAATSPVVQGGGGDGWTVGFFLSNTLTPDAAPAPNDKSIELVMQPETLLGSLRYSGNNDAGARAAAKERLLATLAGQARWQVVDDVSWAQYDQPFAVPFLKRNEAHVALAPTGAH